MNYIVFFSGALLGVVVGLVTFSCLGAGRHSDHQHEVWQAYQDGYDAGQRQGKAGCTLHPSPKGGG